MAFDYLLNFKRVNFREDPYLYRVGKGEQGVLLCEPYKSEILPFWKFKTPELAQTSAQQILDLFYRYKQEEDFVGMDMARKFLQMGYTRSRRYANHRSGKKYQGAVPQLFKGVSGAHGRDQLPKDEDPQKARSASIFFKFWQKVEKDPLYQEMKREWKLWYG